MIKRRMDVLTHLDTVGLDSNEAISVLKKTLLGRWRGKWRGSHVCSVEDIVKGFGRSEINSDLEEKE